MRKKLLKLLPILCCFILLFTTTAFAADSPSTGADSPSTGDTDSGDTGSGDTGSGDTGSGDTGSGDTGSGDTGSGSTDDTTAPAEEMAAGVSASSKVVINGVETEVTVTILPVTKAVVTQAETQAKALVSETATVLKVVDISLPAGDYSAGVQITMSIPGVQAGQDVAVLHQKADGSWENLTVNRVENDSVTATFYSFSPVAIVVGATAPSTGSQSNGLVVILMIAALAGVVVSARKAFVAEA